MSLNFQALCYLSAWEKKLSLSGGLAWEAQLRKCRLDYSWASLHRLDHFLDALRKQLKPDYDEFLKKQEQVNLLLLIAFYVGELRARVSGKPIAWLSYDEALAADPAAAKYGAGFHSALIIEQGMTQFLPLISICTRLFSAEPDRSVAHSAGMHLTTPVNLAKSYEPLAAQNLIPDFFQRYQKSVLTEPHKQWTSTLTQNFPGECAGFRRLQKDAPELLRSGRVVWAAIVQANSYLYEVHPDLIAPAEVLYDPEGRMNRIDLHHFAHELMQAREDNFNDPEVQRYVSHLRAETTQIFDWQTPASLCPYTLRASSILLNAEIDFPGYALCSPLIPILVSEDCAGTVMVAPWQLWPKEIFDEWLEFARQRHGETIRLPNQVSGYQAISGTEPKLNAAQAARVTSSAAQETAQQGKAQIEKNAADDAQLHNYLGLLHRLVLAGFLISILTLANLLWQTKTIAKAVMFSLDTLFFWWLLRASRQGLKDWYLNRGASKKDLQIAKRAAQKARHQQVKHEPVLRILILLVTIAAIILYGYASVFILSLLPESAAVLALFAVVLLGVGFWQATKKFKAWLTDGYLRKKQADGSKVQRSNQQLAAIEGKRLTFLGLLLIGIGGYFWFYLSEVERVKEALNLPPLMQALYESHGKLGPASIFFVLGAVVICVDVFSSRLARSKPH